MSLATHSAHSKDFDQPGQMPRLILVFAGAVILLVSSCSGLYVLLIRMLSDLVDFLVC